MSHGSAHAGPRPRVFSGALRPSGVCGCLINVRRPRCFEREVEIKTIGPICDAFHVTDDSPEKSGLFLFLGHVLLICHQISPDGFLCSADAMVENHDRDRSNL